MQNYKDRKPSRGCLGLGWEWGLTFKCHEITFGSDGNVIKLDSGMFEFTEYKCIMCMYTYLGLNLGI